MTDATKQNKLLWMLLLLFPMICLRGWVLSVVWGWFVAPLFALPELKFTPAIGLMIVVDFLKPKELGDSDRSVAYMIGLGISNCILTLGIGWIIMRAMR